MVNVNADAISNMQEMLSIEGHYRIEKFCSLTNLLTTYFGRRQGISVNEYWSIEMLMEWIRKLVSK